MTKMEAHEELNAFWNHECNRRAIWSSDNPSERMIGWTCSCGLEIGFNLLTLKKFPNLIPHPLLCNPEEREKLAMVMSQRWSVLIWDEKELA